MSDDIVKRLRDRGVCSIAQNSCRNDYACESAADEIERLRADNAVWMRMIGAEKKYRAELEATVKHQAARIHAQRDEINRLLAGKADEIERLRWQEVRLRSSLRDTLPYAETAVGTWSDSVISEARAILAEADEVLK